LKRLARANHANFIVGPVRASSGTFAAYSVVPSVYCCRNPHSRLQILRWHGDAWVTDGSLTPIRTGRYWNFPDFSLYSPRVRRADADAPLFAGTVNGAGAAATMIAVQVSGRWRWATFVGCAMGDTCGSGEPRSTIVLNPRYAGQRLTTLIGNCDPDCADPSTTYRTEWRWSAETGEFVVTESHQTTM
jgi:hypothetical protein